MQSMFWVGGIHHLVEQVCLLDIVPKTRSLFPTSKNPSPTGDDLSISRCQENSVKFILVEFWLEDALRYC